MECMRRAVSEWTPVHFVSLLFSFRWNWRPQSLITNKSCSNFVGQKWIEWDDWSILHNSLSFWVVFRLQFVNCLAWWDQCNCVGGNKVTPNFVYEYRSKQIVLSNGGPSWSIMNFAHQHGISLWFMSTDTRYVNQQRRVRIFVFAFDAFRTLIFSWSTARRKALLLFLYAILIWNAQVKYIFACVGLVNEFHAYSICAHTHRPKHVSFTHSVPACCLMNAHWIRCAACWSGRGASQAKIVITIIYWPPSRCVIEYETDKQAANKPNELKRGKPGRPMFYA